MAISTELQLKLTLQFLSQLVMFSELKLTLDMAIGEDNHNSTVLLSLHKVPLTDTY